jgi:hypothetical protein
LQQMCWRRSRGWFRCWLWRWRWRRQAGRWRHRPWTGHRHWQWTGHPLWLRTGWAVFRCGPWQHHWLRTRWAVCRCGAHDRHSPWNEQGNTRSTHLGEAPQGPVFNRSAIVVYLMKSMSHSQCRRSPCRDGLVQRQPSSRHLRLAEFDDGARHLSLGMAQQLSLAQHTLSLDGTTHSLDGTTPLAGTTHSLSRWHNTLSLSLSMAQTHSLDGTTIS